MVDFAKLLQQRKQQRTTIMASRTNVPKFDAEESIPSTTPGTKHPQHTPTLPHTDEVEEVPTQYTTDDTDSTLSTNAPGMTFEGGSYDDDYKKLNPPTGDWQKDDRWDTVKMFVNENDQQAGDKNPVGRTYFSVSGKPIPRVAFEVEHQPTLFLRISPDKRYKEDEPNKFDSSYKLFMEVREAYLAIHGKLLTNETDLRYFLVEDDYIVRTMKGDNGPIVVNVKVKRERK